MSSKFTEYSQLNLSEVNKEVLKKWDENDVFSKSMTEREGYPSFVFYEGPPSANGMPGIHHVMARIFRLSVRLDGIHTDCRLNLVLKRLWVLLKRISVRLSLWQNIIVIAAQTL